MIKYVRGDATLPSGGGNKIIAHVVNNEGAMGKGFVVPLMDSYPNVKQRYQAWKEVGREDGTNFDLGNVQFVEVSRASLFEPEITWVANMVAQRGYRNRQDDPALKYLDEAALRSSLYRVASFAMEAKATVHMPRIGCGLGGSSWDEVEPIIEQTLGARSINVTVYDLGG